MYTLRYLNVRLHWCQLCLGTDLADTAIDDFFSNPMLHRLIYPTSIILTFIVTVMGICCVWLLCINRKAQKEQVFEPDEPEPLYNATSWIED